MSIRFFRFIMFSIFRIQQSKQKNSKQKLDIPILDGRWFGSLNESEMKIWGYSPKNINKLLHEIKWNWKLHENFGNSHFSYKK